MSSGSSSQNPTTSGNQRPPSTWNELRHMDAERAAGVLEQNPRMDSGGKIYYAGDSRDFPIYLGNSDGELDSENGPEPDSKRSAPQLLYDSSPRPPLFDNSDDQPTEEESNADDDQSDNEGSQQRRSRSRSRSPRRSRSRSPRSRSRSRSRSPEWDGRTRYYTPVSPSSWPDHWYETDQESDADSQQRRSRSPRQFTDGYTPVSPGYCPTSPSYVPPSPPYSDDEQSDNETTDEDSQQERSRSRSRSPRRRRSRSRSRSRSPRRSRSRSRSRSPRRSRSRSRSRSPRWGGRTLHPNAYSPVSPGYTPARPDHCYETDEEVPATPDAYAQSGEVESDYEHEAQPFEWEDSDGN